MGYCADWTPSLHSLISCSHKMLGTVLSSADQLLLSVFRNTGHCDKFQTHTYHAKLKIGPNFLSDNVHFLARNFSFGNL